MTERAPPIALWVVDLAEELEADEATRELSREELHRASRLRFPEHRRCFLRAHLALRRVLARFCHRPPPELRFRQDEQGKPALADLANPPHFNLSHSGNYAAIAVCEEAPVGVDCEAFREVPDAQALAQRFFAAEEQRQLAGLNGDALHRAFLRIWTAKEASLKGIGLGLRLPLHSFAVSLTSAGRPHLVRVDEAASVLRGWHLYEVAIPAPLALAVASPLAAARVCLMHSPDALA